MNQSSDKILDIVKDVKQELEHHSIIGKATVYSDLRCGLSIGGSYSPDDLQKLISIAKKHNVYMEINGDANFTLGSPYAESYTDTQVTQS